MRIAFIGKGGAGKSTIVGTFSRFLARQDGSVLVLDSDVMPGLAGALGLPFDDAPIPAEAVVPGPDGGPKFVLRPDMTVEQIMEKYAARAPDDVRLLQLGKLSTSAWSRAESMHAFDQIKAGMRDTDWHLIGDLPGGTRQPFMGWSDFAETLVVVVEPSVKSYVTARRMRRLASADERRNMVAIANKVERHDDVARIAEETGLEVIGAVPFDRAVREADRDALSLIDHAPDSPAAVAIASLVTSMNRSRQ